MWIYLAVLSSLFLGSYDLCKKASLQNNAVLPVLVLSTSTAAAIFLPLVLWSAWQPDVASKYFFYIPFGNPHDHLFYLIKSVIVGSSWVTAYYAVKHLPITIAGPIRASAPVWAIVGAVVIFGERLQLLQWIGLLVTITFYYVFSLAGNREGISFRKNKWVIMMSISTLIASVSTLYDKYLIMHYNKLAVQAYSTLYMVPMFLLLLLVIWYPRRKESTPFKWRTSIPLIAVFLVIADYAYFFAIAVPGSLIAIISALRRGNVLVSFTAGSIIFREKNIKNKAFALVGILVGILLIILGSR
jgi:bacterial/archaeal transporter family protein